MSHNITYRLASNIPSLSLSDGAFNYVFMSYVPMDAGVKNKMLYAATRATLKRIFGDNRIATEVS